MADIATLGLAVDSSGVKRATDDLKAFAAQGQATETAASKVAGAAKDIGDKMTASERSIQSITASLKLQANTLGMTSDQISIYKMRLAGATDEQIRAAQVTAQVIQNYRASAQAAREAAAASAAASSAAIRRTPQSSYLTPSADTGNSSAGLLGMASGFRMLTGAAIAYQALNMGREFIQTADAMAMMNSRLSLVTTGASNLASVQSQLFAAAQESRADLLSIGRLYSNIALQADQLGVSQTRLVGFTKSISQAFQINGATAQESSSATRQLTQALASGVLRGDEFNSIMENGAPIAQALAQYLGKTTGELRKMAEEGKLTAEIVFAAIEASGQKFEDQFNRLPVTVDGAYTLVKNATSILVDDLNKQFNITGTLASSLTWFANKLLIINAQRKLSNGYEVTDPSVAAGVTALKSENNARVKELEGQLEIISRDRSRGIKSVFEMGGSSKESIKAEIEQLKAKNAAMTQEVTIKKTLREVENEYSATEKAAADAKQKRIDEYEKKHGNRAMKKADAIKDAATIYDGEKNIPAWRLKEIDEQFKGPKGPSAPKGTRDTTVSEMMRQDVLDVKAVFADQESAYKENQSRIKALRAAGLLDEETYATQSAVYSEFQVAATKAAFAEERAILQARADLLGKSSKQEDLNEAAKIKTEIARATEQERKALQALDKERNSEVLAETIRKEKILRDAYAQADQATAEYAARVKELNEQKRLGLRDDVYLKLMGEAQEKYRVGMLNQQAAAWTRFRGEMQRSKEPIDQLRFLTITAAEDIQNSLGETTKNLLEGNFDAIGASFEKMVSNMMMRAAQAQLDQLLFGNASKAMGGSGMGDGFIGKLFGAGMSLFGGTASTYGTTAGSQQTAMLAAQDAGIGGGGIGSFLSGIFGMAEGGSTQANSTYEVAEKGPEIYNQGGRQYLLTGNQSGSVTRNSQLGGGGNANVNVTILGNAKVKSDTTRTAPDGSSLRDLVIQVVSGDIANGGNISEAMQGTYGLNRWNGAR